MIWVCDRLYTLLADPYNLGLVLEIEVKLHTIKIQEHAINA